MAQKSQEKSCKVEAKVAMHMSTCSPLSQKRGNISLCSPRQSLLELAKSCHLLEGQNSPFPPPRESSLLSMCLQKDIPSYLDVFGCSLSPHKDTWCVLQKLLQRLTPFPFFEGNDDESLVSRPRLKELPSLPGSISIQVQLQFKQY